MSDNLILGLTKRIVVVDAETCSQVDLPKEGGARYWRHPSTRVLMLSFKELGTKQTFLWQPHLNPDTPKFLEEIAALPPEECLIAAYNVGFDAEAMLKLGIDRPRNKYIDIQMLAYALSFAGKLNDVLSQFDVRDVHGRPLRKNPEGPRLITLFSKRQSPWYDYPAEWAKFGTYCIEDSEVEVELLKKCLAVLDKPAFYPMIANLYRQWLLNQRINARGVPVSTKTVEGALKIKKLETERIIKQMKEITGLANPNSPKQLMEWVESKGYPMVDMKAENLREFIDDPEMPEDVQTVLGLRLLVGKASVKKYDAFAAQQVDGRLKASYTFLGASRTGRDASRGGLNLNNIERGRLKDPASAADVIEWGDPDAFKFWLEGKDAATPPLEILGSCVRSALVAPDGYNFTVADLSSIESVGLAYLAGCKSILEMFHQGEDTYKTFASAYYLCAYDEVTKAMRSFSKPAVLGCFSGHTEVLTPDGYKYLAVLKREDLVWDGIAFVEHEGVIYKGHRDVIRKYGVRATPDHKVKSYQDAKWVTWGDFEAPQFFDEDAASYNETCATYDILNCGPRNQFKVRTSYGHMIAHNCGYGASGRALVAYAKGLGVEMDEETATKQVKLFRDLYPEIPLLWKNVDIASKSAVRNPGETFYAFPCKEYSKYGARFHKYGNWPYLSYYYDKESKFLMCGLPSGRTIFYYDPSIMTMQRASNKKGPNGETQYYNQESVYYGGRTQDAGGAWKYIQGSGPKSVENATQAYCRDVLFHGMELIDQDRMSELVGSVYDEVLTLSREGDSNALKRVIKCMTTLPPWLTNDFYLGASGFTARRYKKD